MKLRIILALAVVCASAVSAADRTVTIESARSTEYISDSQDGSSKDRELIRFRGDVKIVVTEGTSVSKIGADEVTYDKNKDMLEARGNVTYEHTTGKSGSQKFKGQALRFDIKKQEGVFLSGAVTQETGKAKSDPYIIQAEISGRDSSTTMAFKNGVLTTCDADNPHWSINASRIWLLPGNEIAILNGIFFIGPLPVFYIPAFYYPSDEMIFHPVFGFRNREGYFVQTSTYLYGRKPIAAKSSTTSGTSFSDFLQSDTLKEQKREGLFLRNLESDAKSTSSDYFKIVADTYSSLGYMTGADGSFSGTGLIKSLSFSGYAGFSRTLFPPSSGLFYSTYDSTGTEYWNSGWFFGNELPFRYRANLSLTFDKKPFRLTATLPLISDPFFKQDFLDRSEDLNWFTLLTDQAELASGSSISQETSFSWNLNGSVQPDVSFAAPWLTTFSISSFSGLLSFNSKPNATITGSESSYSPERRFFYPEMIKPEFKAALAGTLISSSKTRSPKKKEAEKEKPDIGSLENPFTDSSAEPDDTLSAQKAPDKTEAERFIPAAGTTGTSAITSSSGQSAWSVTWNVDPSVVQEIRYNPTDWESPDEIGWNTYSSIYYQAKATGALKGAWSYDQNFLDVSSSVSLNGTRQDHPWLSDEVYDTEAKKNTVKLVDYKASTYTVENSSSVKCVPLNRHAVLKPVSFAWNFTGDLIKSEFTGTVDEPEWETKPLEWEKDFIDVHSATAVIGAKLGGYDQKFTLVSNLPPLLESWTGTAAFATSFLNASFSSKLYEKTVDDEDDWLWDPFKASLTWTLPFGVKAGQEYAYDLQGDEPSRLHFSLSKNGASAFYTFTNTVPYELVAGSGWKLSADEKEFLPSAAGLSYTNSAKPLSLNLWKNRVSLQAKVSTNVKFNLLKLTESSFDFVPTITFKIYEFLDLSFSSTSRNSEIARYFQDWMDLPAPLPGETNLVTDLVKSFNFWNEQDRTATGYKLKSLSMEMTHYLHDWTANLKVSVKPELQTDGGYRYEFTPIITFVVQWKPISDIKTTVTSEKGVFSLNTTDETDE
ncbi:LPS-assembly protein LptD [Treponema zuelzerae]|uniref:LPS-assembly protein LptD n=1 Tax=Teretinema zuelzerae TaxID=156 RepID=A0AAE3EGU8_9SPIR|nr:LPS-assembly protein LptD [Teretinema zuelzerae]MCD1654710.1 LPS-assembly protein LptD [Teretinema zuelzerae]